MRSIVFTVCVFLSIQVWGQTSSDFQKEIDETVWKPFKAAFENLDGTALNQTYAEEVLRVTPEGIDTENLFKASNLQRFEQSKIDGISIALDFWFDSRFTNGSTSYEVGFYRITFTDKLGKESSSYGQFHIVLKKRNGKWEITQDWDTAIINGKAIDAEDFAKREPMKF